MELEILEQSLNVIIYPKRMFESFLMLCLLSQIVHISIAIIVVCEAHPRLSYPLHIIA